MLGGRTLFRAAVHATAEAIIAAKNCMIAQRIMPLRRVIAAIKLFRLPPRVASIKALLNRGVASPKMLPTIVNGTMPPSPPGRGHGYHDDAHGTG